MINELNFEGWVTSRYIGLKCNNLKVIILWIFFLFFLCCLFSTKIYCVFKYYYSCYIHHYHFIFIFYKDAKTQNSKPRSLLICEYMYIRLTDVYENEMMKLFLGVFVTAAMIYLTNYAFIPVKLSRWILRYPRIFLTT